MTDLAENITKVVLDVLKRGGDNYNIYVAVKVALAASPLRGRETQETICGWTEATFGTASSNARVASRANEEMAELLRALTSDDSHPKAVEEAADVVIILYRLAHRMGSDLHAEIDRKMQINRKREWKVTNGHGYHVRDKNSVAPALPPEQAAKLDLDWDAWLKPAIDLYGPKDQT